jgi:hypothetical protein
MSNEVREKAIEELAAFLCLKPMDAADVAYPNRVATFRELPSEQQAHNVAIARRVFDLLGLVAVDPTLVEAAKSGEIDIVFRNPTGDPRDLRPELLAAIKSLDAQMAEVGAKP